MTSNLIKDLNLRGSRLDVLHSEVNSANNTLAVKAGVSLVPTTGNVSIAPVVGSITLAGVQNAANAIKLSTNGGTAETIVVTNTKGTAAGAITLGATVGGITLSAATGKGITVGNKTIATQLTSTTTGVACAGQMGTITTIAGTLAAGGEETFTVTCSSCVAATSVVLVSLKSNAGTGTPLPFCSAVASGSFNITVSNLHASAALSGALDINYLVIN
jgi:hypothetical protein